MKWSLAMQYAEMYARARGIRYYVRGYRTANGWRYGFYRVPRPALNGVWTSWM